MTYFTIYLIACWSVIGATVWSWFPGAPLLIGGLALYTAVPLYVFFHRFRWSFYPGALFRLFVIRVLLYTQLLLPIVTLAAIIGLITGWPFGASVLAARAVASVAVAGAAVILLIGYIGSKSLVVRDVEARMPSLPHAFDGMRIVQLSDLHVGPHSSRSFLQRVSRTVETLRPDAIVVTGDLIDDRPEDVAVYARHLGGLGAPHGVFMIPGNHDVYAGWNDVAGELERLISGHILVNRAHLVERGGARLAIVGTGDPAGFQRGAGAQVAPDIELAFRSVPQDVPAVVLAHNPALWPAIVKHRRATLTLSGHTHWGQFAFPKRNWNLASRFVRHSMGAYQEGDSLLYVSPGTGFWGIPFRIGALPEITVVTLRSTPVAGFAMAEARSAVEISYNGAISDSR